MKVKNKKLVILSLIFSLLIPTSIILNFIKIIPNEMNEKRNNLPKLSNQNINITSPENKTYTEPMSAYYPASYGFENDEDGSDPDQWTVIEAGGTANILNELDGHKKIIELHDINSELVNVSNYFNLIEHGTVECWVRSNDVTERTFIEIKAGSSEGIYLILRDDDWQYWNSSGIVSIQKASGGNMDTPLNNIWYHIRIDFECGTSNYAGLAEDHWRVYINGIKSVDTDFFNGEVHNGLNVTTFHTHGTLSNYYSYYDALGYSWDPNYNIGDNLNEGLLLSFDNSTTLDWIGYSLDKEANRTILGNATIPMPEDGLHTIQIFGNDSSGIIHQSDVRDFSVDFPIDLIAPEAKTYNKAMDGYYPATYGFENDENDATPQEWVNQSQTYAYAKVINAIGGHNKVLECYSGSETASYMWLSNYFETKVDGMIEWWWRKSSTQSSAGIFMLYGSTEQDLIQIGMDNQNYPNKIIYSDETGTQTDTGYAYADDRWIHMRIEFNCAIDNWSLWIDNIKYIDNVNFKLSRTADFVNRTVFWSLDGGHPTLYYVDAVGYSWDPNYNIGDNLNEGLLLCYENSTAFDWIGYSLDGQANKTILGNKTIKIPQDGAHTIKVYGKNSSRNIFHSNLRHFSVHHINIITPEDKIYTEPMSGYYPATYGFESDETGKSPNNWQIDDNGGSATIIENFNGHKKVFYLEDSSTEGNIKVNQTFDMLQTSGVIEFWFADSVATNSETSTWISLIDSNDAEKVRLLIDDNQLRYGNGTGQPIVIDNFGNDLWHQIGISFNASTDTCDIWADGLQIITNEPWFNSGDNITKIMFNTRINQAPDIYIDALGYSWDPNYNIRDNIYEGLLLGFENSTALNWIGYSLDGQATKTILGNTTIPIPSDGLKSIQVFGNDSFGTNYNSEIRHFEIDLNPPLITINSPNFNDPFGTLAPNFDLTITENNRNTTWYTLDNGITNTTLTGLSGTINQTEWYKLTDGPVTITFYANDSFGRLGYAEVIVQKDMTSPVITINSPNLNDLFGTFAPDFDLTIDEINLHLIWYTMDGGITKFFITELNDTIDQDMWNSRPNGLNTVRFYANDTTANLGFSENIIEKDTAEPIITINSPNEGEIFTITPPTFSLSINESNLDSIWYTIDEGPNSILCSNTGQIDDPLWQSLGPREHILHFYANDTLGNVGFTEVIIVKGEVVPVVTFEQQYYPFFIFLIIAAGSVGLFWFINKKYK